MVSKVMAWCNQVAVAVSNASGFGVAPERLFEKLPTVCVEGCDLGLGSELVEAFFQRFLDGIRHGDLAIKKGAALR